MFPDSPDVYTNVFRYLDWIKNGACISEGLNSTELGEVESTTADDEVFWSERVKLLVVIQIILTILIDIGCAAYYLWVVCKDDYETTEHDSSIHDRSAVGNESVL